MKVGREKSARIYTVKGCCTVTGKMEGIETGGKICCLRTFACLPDRWNMILKNYKAAILAKSILMLHDKGHESRIPLRT